MNKNIKVECTITDKRVPKVEAPRNKWRLEIVFEDVREAEELHTYTIDKKKKKDLEKALALLTVLNEIKKRLSNDWNQYCNRGAYEFDDVISDIGLETIISGDDLYNLPKHEDSNEILGRFKDCSIVYFDDIGEDYICKVDYK